MTDSPDLIGFRHIHSACDCEITTTPDRNGLTPLEKEGCDVTVEGLVIALDCDVCHAFSERDTRPDIIAVQRCSGQHQWLIMEMKTTMREHAAKQARAALKRLGHDPMFQVHIDNVSGSSRFSGE